MPKYSGYIFTNPKNNYITWQQKCRQVFMLRCCSRQGTFFVSEVIRIFYFFVNFTPQNKYSVVLLQLLGTAKNSDTEAAK